MFFNGKKKQTENLLKSFGELKNDAFDFDLIELYFRRKDHASAFQVLSDKTCNDLDFNELFEFIDRTNSRVGQQYLYNKLRVLPSNLKGREKDELVIEKLTKNPDVRVKIQLLLSGLAKKPAFYISSLFQEAHLKPPKWFFIIRLLSFASLLSIIMIFFNPKVFLILIGVFIVNMVIHYWNKRNLYPYYGSLPQLVRLNDIAKALFDIDDLKIVNPNLKDATKTIDKIGNRMSFFKLEENLQGDLSILFWMAIEFIKILFLLEPLFLFNVLSRLDTRRNEIGEVFKFVGGIDALVSIASLRKGLESYCIPTISESDINLDAQDIYHPFISNCVENSITVNHKSVLLTGSNMSGKTTFIRTIGINAISALTINTCFAKAYSIPQMRIFSAIRISDDLMNDKSYYFEEVLTIRQMIEHCGKGESNLFLLDEIFKGTNTVERISAGKSVLSYLAKGNNLVFVSTHDIELADLLKDEFNLYHFSEQVDHKTIDFDYKLKDGKLKNRNAIKILKINGYPESIIDEAINLSKEMDKKS